MTDAPNPHPNEREILLVTLDLPTAEQAAYLEKACQGDAKLKARLERLLEEVARAGSFMAAPAVDLHKEPSTTIDVGKHIDRYRLMEQIGEGGMGVVFVAEQTEPVRRKVALKIIKPGMDSKAVIARFEAERQALAMMDHPNIARVLDAGTTRDRLPYFVMELVRGLPITQYCDQACLNIDDRLELFIEVCHAVQHAHQKAIIHRDLKPSNILVTLHDGKPVVKVIDFGVAKALNQQLSQHTIYTALNQVMGTPLYMSPEQLELSGLDIDTRADIYSLGVVLYELLSGSTPFDRERLYQSGFDEMRRIIREEEPPRPSHRLTTVAKAELTTLAKARGIDELSIPRAIRHELDWIALKALEKDRARRYESASELSADVERYLHDQPVLACPPTLAYRLRKSARKHRGPLIASAFVLGAMLIGTSLSVYQALRATKAERESAGRLIEITGEQAKTRDAMLLAQRAEEQQRRLRKEAEELARKEEAAAGRERELRAIAEAVVSESQWNLYTARLLTMRAALTVQDYGRLNRMLNESIPKPNEIDYRGWEWYYLRQCTDAAYRELPVVDGKLPGGQVSFHPSKNQLATFAYPSSVDIYDTATMTHLRRFDCDFSLGLLEWSPDGQSIAICTGAPAELIVLRAEDGQVLWRSQPVSISASNANGLTIHALSWNPDSRQIAVGSRSGNIAIVDLRSKTTTVLHTPTSELLGALDWHPDGRHLAAGLRYGHRLIFDTRSDRRIALNKHNLEVGEALAWNPSGTILATSEGGAIRLANLQGDDLGILQGHVGKVQALTWGDDATLVSSSYDRSVRVWDVVEKAERRQLRLFDAWVGDLDTRRQQDGVDVALTSAGWGVRLGSLFDVPAPPTHFAALAGEPDEVIAARRTEISHLQWAPDGSMLCALATVSRQQRYGSLATLMACDSLRPVVAFPLSMSKGFSWTEDSLRILRAESGDRLCVNDARTGALMEWMSCPIDEPIAIWNPDRQRVMTYKEDNTPVLRSVRSATVLQQWSAKLEQNMYSGAWNPAGTQFIAAGHGDIAKLEIGGGRTQPPDPQSSGSFAIDWHPSGVVFATGNQKGEVIIRDSESLEMLAFLQGHDANVTGVHFSPDGRRLATASADRTVGIWDVASGQLLLQIDSPTRSGLTQVAWSPDGLSLAVGTGSGETFLLSQSGMTPPNSALAIPQHGAVYRHFRNRKAEHLFARHVPPAPWREPLNGLTRAMQGFEIPLTLAAFTEATASWRQKSLQSSEEFDSYALAWLRMIDAHRDHETAVAVARGMLQHLSDHGNLLEPARRADLELQALYRLCHRLSSMHHALCDAAEFQRTIELADRVAHDNPENVSAWRMAHHLDVLFLDSLVRQLGPAVGESAPANGVDAHALKRAIERYENRIATAPTQAFDFNPPTDPTIAVRLWIQRLTEAEVGQRSTSLFAEQWLEYLEENLQRNVQEYRPHYEHALARLATGDLDAYRAACQRMLTQFTSSDDPIVSEAVAWTLSLAPQAVEDYTPALELYRMTHDQANPGFRLGALLYRSGEFEQAKEILLSDAEMESTDTSVAYVWYFLAMTEAQLQHQEAAENWLNRANQDVEEPPADVASTLWFRRATLRVLREEASQLILSQAGPTHAADGNEQ